MKKILLPEGKGRFKANLHCHTTISDGRMTPEQVKEYYKERGYSIVAYTDHEILVGHNELTDGEFLALNGFELEVYERLPNTPFKLQKTCHFCLVARDSENLMNVACSHGKYVICAGSKPYIDRVVYDESETDIEREYTPECINRIMKRCRDAGFFVTYNHPGWSYEEPWSYMSYEGFHAMEMVNYASCVGGYPEHNEMVYDQMLRSGKRIFAVAADDNHSAASSCGAYVVVLADKLEYKTVTDALLRGDFYASEGPEIGALWYEDGCVHIKTSPVCEARMNLGIRGAKIKTSGGESFTEATFPLDPDAKYFRITVRDDKGLYAYTSAYFLDELEF